MLQGAVLYAKHLEKLADFYCLFGGNIVEQQEGDFVVIKDGTSELALVQIPKHIAENIHITSPPAMRAQTPVKLIFVVPSLRRALTSAAEHGGTSDPDTEAWEFRGHMIKDGVDPEGNVFQLWQPKPA